MTAKTSWVRRAAIGLIVAGMTFGFAAEVAGQGSSSSGGTSTGVGRGTQSPSGPTTPQTPQPGTASPGTSSTGTSSMGTTSPSGRTDMPVERTPAPSIVDRNTDTGRGDTSGGTIGSTSPTGGRGTTNLTTMPSAQIQSLQSALNRAGVAVAVDGQFGPETQRALQQYQRDNGLPASGELDDQTRSRLGIEGGR